MSLSQAAADRLVAVLLVLMGIANIVLGAGLWLQRQEAADFTRCTAEWQADFLSAYEARADASVVVSDAMDAIVQAVATQDSAAFQSAVKHYVAVRARQNQERAQNPLPPLPSVQCGE